MSRASNKVAAVTTGAATAAVMAVAVANGAATMAVNAVAVAVSGAATAVASNSLQVCPVEVISTSTTTCLFKD
ncbi:hypothetical protein D3C86_2214320 [compost metagenome]